MVRLEIEGNHAGQRLDKFLGKYLPEAPVSFFYRMLRKKNIILNGKRAEGREKLRVGDQVTLWLADETILKFGGYLPREEITDNQILSQEHERGKNPARRSATPACANPSSSIAQTSQEQTDQEQTDQKQPDQKQINQKHADRKQVSQKRTDRKQANQKHADRKQVSQKQTDQKQASQKQADQKQANQKQPDQKQTDHAGGTDDEIVLYHQAYRRLRGISVIYEDSHVLILDKPAGVLTQQANAGDLSLNEWMIGYLLDTGAISPHELRLFRPSVCNRLDRNTSGLVLCGKSLPGSQALSELIRSRAVRKFYRTVCVGTPAASAGAVMEIQGYLQKNPRTNQVVIRPHEPGEYIRTAYRPMRQYSISRNSLPTRTSATQSPQRENAGVSSGADTILLTELEMDLITGRTHQIRAHLASIGHPLVGDHKYGNTAVNRLFRQRFGLRWQLLHAGRLQFPDLDGVLAPLSGQSVSAPLPEYYETIVAELKTTVPPLDKGKIIR